MRSGRRSIVARSRDWPSSYLASSARNWVTYAAKRASSSGRAPFDSTSRSNRANSVTWPRETPRRMASRTSPSHRASTPGSLMDGLKNRWLTERTSTLTRPLPTSPSAAPKPVMLRIISSRVSYDAATILSIPEIPSHAVELRLARKVVTGNLRVSLLKQVPELVGDDRRLHADFQLERDEPISGPGANGIGGDRKPRRRRPTTGPAAGHQPPRADCSSPASCTASPRPCPVREWRSAPSERTVHSHRAPHRIAAP